MRLRVSLNGTSTNPWHRLGLTRNPFPQLARAELDGGVARIEKLGADPIPDVAYIRTTLAGFSEEFVELCCSEFVPGKMVRFEVSFPDPRGEDND